MIKTKWVTPQPEKPKPKRRIPTLDLMPHITGSMTTLQIANRAGYSRGYILRTLNWLEWDGKVKCEVVKSKDNRHVLYWEKT